MELTKSPAVLIAAVLSVAAGAGAYLDVHGAQARADKNASLVSVFSVQGTIPPDTTAARAYAAGLIHSTRMPAQYRPAQAVTSLAQINGDVAAFDLPAGEVLVADMFVSPKTIPSVAAEAVPAGDVALSVSVDQAHGVAGLVAPGDEVDILVDRDTTETYLYQDVPVLAVNTTLVPGPGRSTPSDATTTAAEAAQTDNVITLAVTPAAATRIALAQSGGGGVTGGIYLALEAAGNPTAPATTVTRANLVPGVSATATSNTTGSSSSSVNPAAGSTAPNSGSRGGVPVAEMP